MNPLLAGARCTLRAAIQEANKLAGADTIAFNIPGNGPHTVSPATQLPLITRRVTIDGYTRGDATADPTIELAGSPDISSSVAMPRTA